MAQWSRTDRTLYAKLVYYGPALGGKTTNLKVLHQRTDPEGRETLVSVETADDRTLFFDLLPFELGSVLGYKVAIKLYTVPGQVRYNATRRVVLAGADAIVFVADSDPERERDNRVAWDNLRLNMRANRLDPAAVPILVQLNKRDVPGAAAPATMAGWFGVDPERVMPAIARDGPGVVETFVVACRAMLERLVALAEPPTRRSLDAGDLGAQLDRAFAPIVARDATAPPAAAGAPTPLVLDGDDLLSSAVAGGVALGSQLADAHGRASRLEREAEALRGLSDALRTSGASFDRRAVMDTALEAARASLSAAGVGFAASDASGGVRIERSAGRDLAPLAADRESGAALARMIASAALCVVDDLAVELPGAALRCPGLRAIAVVPVDRASRSALVVAMPAPDGRVTDGDACFLATLAGHLAVGLDKVRLHAELSAHRDRLEETVRARTRALRKAYDELATLDARKDRFLSGASHEMRTPLTAIIGAASFLKDYDGDREQRQEMAETILEAARILSRRVDELLRVATLDAAEDARVRPVLPADVVAEALRLAGAERSRTRVVIDPRVETLPADAPRLARAIANLVDNAIKFGPEDGTVEIHVGPATLARGGTTSRGVRLAVLDRGAGLAEEDVERVFSPFEQGGDPMTGKPAGVGLGLYEARAIALRHGGTLIHLPRPGGGSEFRISLPTEPAEVPMPLEVRRA